MNALITISTEGNRRILMVLLTLMRGITFWSTASLRPASSGALLLQTETLIGTTADSRYKRLQYKRSRITSKGFSGPV